MVDQLSLLAQKETTEASAAEAAFDKEKQEQLTAEAAYRKEQHEADMAELQLTKEVQEAAEAKKHLDTRKKELSDAEKQVKRAEELARCTNLRALEHKEEALDKHREWAQKIFAMYDRDGRDAINVDDFVGFCVFVDPTVDAVELRKSVMVGGDWIRCDPFCEWLATYASSLTATLRNTFMNI